MDMLKIGQYIQRQRKAAGLTQKELAERLGVSFQAVSKWENGDAMPDTGLLLPLCDALNTTADSLLRGGVLTEPERRLMHPAEVAEAFDCMDRIGELLGRDSTFYTGMVEGISEKMNMDLPEALGNPAHREVLAAEALIQGILSGRTVDMQEVDRFFTNRKMAETVRRFAEKTGS